MIALSITSVLMTILCSNLLIVICSLILQNRKLLASLGFKLLYFSLFLILMRFIFPLEIRFIASNIYLPAFLSQIILIFRKNLFTSNTIFFSLSYILMIIWCIGILYYFIVFIKNQKKANNFLLRYCQNVTLEEPYYCILEKCCQTKNKKNVFEILLVPGISSPCIIGLKKPKILFPQNHQYSLDIITFCILHETSHHFQKDNLIKFILNLITIIYWWNPFCKILSEQTNIILELNTDQSVIKNIQVEDYLSCLISVATQKKKNSFTPPLALSMVNQKNILEHRFFYILNQKSNKLLGLQFIIIIFLLSIFTFSYKYTFENKFYPTSNQSFIMTKDNAFFLLNSNNTYDLYWENEYLETISCIEEYDSSIPVYFSFPKIKN